ncbi:hypothetical protein ACET3Z_029149 [Daucus carota]
MAPKRKTFNTKEAELVEEMERAQQEVETGEKQLMEELLFNETDMIAPSPTTLVFMPTPNLSTTHGLGGTPPPSMPLSRADGTSRATRKKLPVKRARQ